MKHKQALSRRGRSYTWPISETQGSGKGYQQMWEGHDVHMYCMTHVWQIWGYRCIAYRKMGTCTCMTKPSRGVLLFGKIRCLQDFCATSENQCQCPSYSFPNVRVFAVVHMSQRFQRRCSCCRHGGEAVTRRRSSNQCSADGNAPAKLWCAP